MTVNKILFITLSNLGDVVLTLPVLDVLRQRFPSAALTVMVGPRPKDIFENDPFIRRLMVYDKHAPFSQKVRLFRELAAEKFDLVVDLRNTLYGALLPARYRTSPLLRVPRHLRHMRGRNLYRLYRALGEKPPVLEQPADARSGFLRQTDPVDAAYIDGLLSQRGIGQGDSPVVVSPAALGATKRWETERFVRLCRRLALKHKVIITGAPQHAELSRSIAQRCPSGVYDLTGATTLRQLGYLLDRSKLLITCDSGPQQIASYIGTPVIALFGATDDERYGPWPPIRRVVKKEIFCRPCGQAQCRYGTVACMNLIGVADVMRAVDAVMGLKALPAGPHPRHKRILIARTDRIGDVLLSTPVIRAAREAYPNAYIAMMVSPYAREVVEGNPYLDEVILYDKDTAHKNWFSSLLFARRLRSRRFDLGLILHPTNRVHILAWLCGIRRRVGYDRKMGWLLTDRIAHTKQKGEKHEADYALDVARAAGIVPSSRRLYMPLKPENEEWVNTLFAREGIARGTPVLAVHPTASCPSKIWPVERFAAVADALAGKHGFKVVVVAARKDRAYAEMIVRNMSHRAVNLAGATSISRLASVLKRCRLFISNDSGPVHIASAVGTPVISIFGRKQKGLSPRRWGPTGPLDRVVHKDAGCIECLAHGCVREFACLKAIQVADVVAAAEQVVYGSV